MPITVLIAVIAASSGLVSAILTAVITLWLGSKRATNADARLGLDALREGLHAASGMADELTEKLEGAKSQIILIERQAYRVLSENNRFRIIHGVDPAISLETFDPLTEDRWNDLVARLTAKYG